MDLPSCPACGQSVLDDEATDCPFCGASMSGKPGAKPSSKAATASGTTSGEKKRKPGSKDGGGKPASDDPFDVSAPVGRTAHQLLPKPAKGKLHRVLCPMCETPGFSSIKVAGKEVRCANKDCLVPIFTAPALEGVTPTQPVADPVTEEKKGGLSIGMYVVIAVGATALIGGIAWVTIGPGFGSPSTAGLDAPYVPPTPVPGTTPEMPNGSATTDPPQTGEQPATTTVAESAGPSVAELMKSSMADMLKAAQTQNGNNQQVYCIAQVAETYVLLLDAAAAREQLEILQRIHSSQKHYCVLPLVELAWQQLSKGDAAGAGATASEAKQLASTLPGNGLLTLESLTELAAILVTLDRADEAESLFSDRELVHETEEFAELIVRARRVPNRGLSGVIGFRPAIGWTSPVRVAVAFALAARGQGEKSLEWARRSTSNEIVVDCLCGWAEASILTSGSVAPMPQIEAEIASLTPVEQAKVLARCAVMLHSLGDAAGSQNVLAKARQAGSSAKPPAPMAMPDLKTQTELTLPDEALLAHSARATAELAFAEASLGQLDAAWQTVKLADAWTRAIAPSPSLARAPLTEIDRVGAATVTNSLKTALNLLTDDDARSAYIEYRNRVLQLAEASGRRSALQEVIFRAAADWGSGEHVWTEISQRIAQSAAPEIREPWLETRLPSTLYWHFKMSDKEALAMAVETAATPARLKQRELFDARTEAELNAEKAIAGSDFLNAHSSYRKFAQNRSEPDSRWLQAQYLSLTSALVAAGRKSEALQFAAKIPDPATKEFVLELTGRAVTTSTSRNTVNEFLRANPLPPADRVSALRGGVQSLVSLPSAEE
jgi:hypothetical protein